MLPLLRHSLMLLLPPLIITDYTRYFRDDAALCFADYAADAAIDMPPSMLPMLLDAAAATPMPMLRA